MKILLVQTSFLGDVILSTPVIGALKKLHPDAELWIMTTRQARELVERDPFLTGVITFDKRGTEGGVSGLIRKARELRSHKFDIAYALQRSARTSVVLALAKIPRRIGFSCARLSFLYHRRIVRRSSQHDVLRNLSILTNGASLESLPDDLRVIPPAPAELDAGTRSLVEAGRYVVLVPGSAWKTKMWRWQGYREVAEYFLKSGLTVVVSGAPDEQAVANMVSNGLPVKNLAGTTTLSAFAALIAHAELVVCNDSMALHLASAFKRPTVALFCATSPQFGFGPWKSPALVVEAQGLPCKPCRRHGSNRCPTGTEACMKNVSSDQVVEAARQVLAQ